MSSGSNVCMEITSLGFSWSSFIYGNERCHSTDTPKACTKLFKGKQHTCTINDSTGSEK